MDPRGHASADVYRPGDALRVTWRESAGPRQLRAGLRGSIGIAGDVIASRTTMERETWTTRIVWADRGGPRAPTYRMDDGLSGQPGAMFVFFSNRLGCFGSLLVSAVLTLVLLLILNVI